MGLLYLYLYLLHVQEINLFHIHELLGSLLDPEIWYPHRCFFEMLLSFSRSHVSHQDVTKIKRGFDSRRDRISFRNFAQATLPPISIPSDYRRSVPTSYRGMILKIYLHEVYKFKKVWMFPTTLKLPFVEVFSMTMSRSSARTTNLWLKHSPQYSTALQERLNGPKDFYGFRAIIRL
jgi:hypothetical protein